MEIQLYSKLQNPMEAIDRIGEMFARSGMFGCERSEQGKVLAMICLAENKSPVAITRDYDIVEGKLRKKALAALADFRTIMGGKHRWLSSGDVTGATDAETFAEAEFVDKLGNKVTYRYSMQDARNEGLVKDRSRWVKRPGNMLRARCISNGLGMLAPELYCGDDGVSDAPDAPQMNLEPAKSEPKQAVVMSVETVSKVSPPEDAKAEAAAGLAPDPTLKPAIAVETVSVSQVLPSPAVNSSAPVAEAKPFAAGPAYSTPAGTKLSDALVQQVEAAIGEHAIAAVNWMMKEGWLAKGCGLESLTDARARRIIKQRDSFLKAVLGGAK